MAMEIHPGYAEERCSTPKEDRIRTRYAQAPLSEPAASIRYHKLMARFAPGQTLLIDADDTLWENNVYFERAIAAFISYLNHHEYSPHEVRKALNDVERETILAHGYGLTSFTRSLVTCFERLSQSPITEENRTRSDWFRAGNRGSGDRVTAGSQRNFGAVVGTAQIDSHDQGRSRRAGRQIGALRHSPPFRSGRDCGRERPIHLPRCDAAA